MAGGTYLFIDGNYLEQRYAEQMRAFFGNEGDLDYASVRNQASGDVQRAFYYNSIDYGTRAHETADRARERIQAAEQRFDRIEAVRDLHVRPGAVTTGARKRKGQKKVDILLAVDMLTHAHSRNMAQVALIAGDLDFAPLVAAVVRLGVRVTVLYDVKSVSSELLEEADSAVRMRLQTYYGWSSLAFRASNQLPDESTNKGDDFKLSQRERIEFGNGSLGPLPLTLFSAPTGGPAPQFFVSIRDELRRENTVISDLSFDRLLKYVSLSITTLCGTAPRSQALRRPAFYSKARSRPRARMPGRRFQRITRYSSRNARHLQGLSPSRIVGSPKISTTLSRSAGVRP